MTPFAALLATSGLSKREAAHWLRVREDTVQDWSRGRSRAPAPVIEMLASLVESQEIKADEFTSQLEKMVAQQGLPDQIEVGVSADDHEAVLNGFPTRSAEAACIGRALSMMAPDLRAAVRLVPRGSTVATALAEAQHPKGG